MISYRPSIEAGEHVHEMALHLAEEHFPEQFPLCEVCDLDLTQFLDLLEVDEAWMDRHGWEATVILVCPQCKSKHKDSYSHEAFDEP